MMAYLEFLGEELRAKRRELKVALDQKCLVLCDKATQHTSRRYL